jgi:hypothetical protein
MQDDSQTETRNDEGNPYCTAQIKMVSIRIFATDVKLVFRTYGQH